MPSAHVAKEVGSIWADLGGIFAKTRKFPQHYHEEKLDSNIQDD